MNIHWSTRAATDTTLRDFLMGVLDIAVLMIKFLSIPQHADFRVGDDATN